jgi:glutathione-regulated potassium-efflux system ancillary protein KefF
MRYALPMILIIHAHPYPQRSRAGRALLDQASAVAGVEVRSLYDLYPDFDIDVLAEQTALRRADLIVWLHPTYWYSVPAMLKHWFDVVLLRGFAYGDGGATLHGKYCLWAPTTGGTVASYGREGAHQLEFSAFEAPIRQTASFCGLQWLPPFVLHAAHVSTTAEIAAYAAEFRSRLVAWAATQSGATDAH